MMIMKKKNKKKNTRVRDEQRWGADRQAADNVVRIHIHTRARKKVCMSFSAPFFSWLDHLSNSLRRSKVVALAHYRNQPLISFIP